MADFDWPADLVPYSSSFYLQPHTGGSESPFSRVRKTYGLSAPRWVCRMSFRGGDSNRWGTGAHARVGPRLDALIVQLKGGQNRVRLWDFRRETMQSPYWSRFASNLAAVKGATSMTITNLPPGARALAGDYIGGDGRPHLVLADAIAGADGQAVVTFEPPLAANVGEGAAIFGNPTGLFQLDADPDMGANPSPVDQLTLYDLSFTEALQGSTTS